MPPTDDPTDPVEPTTSRRTRVSGAQLLDAIEALPGRIAQRVNGAGSGSAADDGEGGAGTSPLPPEVTFEAEPEPEPEAEPPTPVAAPASVTLAKRRSGFPSRRRRR